MRRTLLAYTPAAVVIALMWMRLESPMRDGLLALWLAALALLPALARRTWTRALGYAGASLLAIGSTLEISPLDPGAVRRHVVDGFLLFYDERVPIDPAKEFDMAGVLLLAVFGFCALLALTTTTRRPVGAAAVLLVGAGWPATLLPGGGDFARGALILGAALVLFAAVRRAGARQIAIAAAVVVAAAVGASTSGAVDRGAFLDWEDWDAYDGAPRPVNVDYVWNGDYAGVTFPEKKTKLFKVQAGPERTYWRATTLDAFDDVRWFEDRPPLLAPAGIGGRAELTLDPLLPAAAKDRRGWRRQVVQILALVDNHLVAGSSPIAFAGAGCCVRYGWGGHTLLEDGRRLQRGLEYTAWSYTPQPRARMLAQLPADYPRDEIRHGRYLRPTRYLSVLPFGTPGRESGILNEFETGFLPPAYEPLYRTAREVVGNPRTPYGAVVALESWFRRNGGFTYDEQPGARESSVPPLVDFLQRKRGYCQHFAGAMALMLRYLGIPSRVAVGFTSGDYDERTGIWTVTDHNAHAWVEVWFPRFGWLPFDPTPARGQLGGGYTASSPGFSPSSPDVLEALGGGVAAELLRREGLEGLRGNQTFGQDGGGSGRAIADGGRAALPVLLLGALLALLALVVGKEARRRARYLRRDPHSLARGARGDVAGFLADQGFDVPASATPSELAALVEERYGLRAERFAQAVATARYAPNGAHAARRARHEARDLERRMRRRLSWRARLRGLMSLRSLRVA